MRLVEHWWDGSWSQLWRRDIWLRTNDDIWTVEARQGVKKEPWSITFGTEDEARELVKAMKDRSGDTWRDLTPTVRPDEGKSA